MTTVKTKPLSEKTDEKEVARTIGPVTKPVASKKARLIRMLSRKHGADVATISKEFGWLPHTTRAALSGLRKAGFDLASEKPGKGKPARYRIAAKPETDAA